MGIPTLVPGVEHSALWMRAYNLVYNQWFRDQNMQTSVPVNRDNGPDSETDYKLLKRGKRHDYFTSSLPFQQKGDPVTIPLGDQAQIQIDLAENVGAIGLLDVGGTLKGLGTVVNDFVKP